MKSPSSELALHELLVHLFDSADLRQWIEYDTDMRVMAHELPGHAASMADLVSKVVRLVDKHGFVNQAFFDRLRVLRPNRASDINGVAALWLPATLPMNVSTISADQYEKMFPSATSVPAASAVPGPTVHAEIRVDDVDLASITALCVLGSPHQDSFLSAIAHLTRMSRKRVIDALAAAPQLRVRDVFPDKWPTIDVLLTLKVSQARRLHLTATIAKHVNWPVETLRERLGDEHGNTLLSRIVERPQQGPVQTSSLGNMTLSEVDRRGLRASVIDFLQERGLMQRKGVTRRFNGNQGNALVRNVFPEVPRDEWPKV